MEQIFSPPPMVPIRSYVYSEHATLLAQGIEKLIPQGNLKLIFGFSNGISETSS
jgi:hypothetical protein